jgi:ferredoxin
MSATIDTCALCPKLCRHVCPVSVGTGRESATPTAMLTEVLLADTVAKPDSWAADAVGLCTRCGACESFCGVDQPVVALLDAARTRHQPAPKPWVAPVIQGHAPTVAIICGEEDWHLGLADTLGQDVAILRTPDHLGERHRIRTDTRDAVITALAKIMQGRTAITSCGTCRTALEAAGITVESISAATNTVPAYPTWRTCHCESGPSVDTVIRCCGARAPLIHDHPDLAATMAGEIITRLEGQTVFVPDTRCASHLISAGAPVVGPINHLFQDGN